MKSLDADDQSLSQAAKEQIALLKKSSDSFDPNLGSFHVPDVDRTDERTLPDDSLPNMASLT